MKSKNISRNYFILAGLVVLVICACVAFYNIYNIVQNNKVSTSPLNELKQIKYTEIKNITNELDADTFLIISYTNDQDIYNNEKDIKKFLTKNNLTDNAIYLDVTEYVNNEGFIDELNSSLNLTGDDALEEIPAVIYYKNGSFVKAIDSKDHLLESSDFDKIIEMYEIAS